MTMTTKQKLITGGVFTALLGVAACGGGGGGGGLAQDAFGAPFAAAFNANANDAPVNPAANDAGGVDATADPINPA